MTDPFYSGPRKPQPKRKLREVPQKGIPSSTLTDRQKGLTPEKVQRLFDGFAFQANRATALLKEVRQVAEKQSIPVDPDAIQVQNAVRRRDSNSDGRTITFDLYRDMVDYILKTARNVSFEIVGEFSGEMLSDSNKIKRYMKSGGKGLSPWEEFLTQADNFLLLFLLNRLIGSMQAQEHRECTAAKQPLGSEEPPIMMRIMMSVAALLMYLGMRNDQIVLAFSQMGIDPGIPMPDLLNRARRLEPTEMDRVLLEAVGSSDHLVITQYVHNYVAKHPEGYAAWMAYRDLLNMREDAVVTYVHAHEYSSEHAKLLDYHFRGEHTDPAPNNTFLNSILPPAGRVAITPAHYMTLYGKYQGLSLGIDSVAQVLTSGFAQDVLCCIARFFGKQEIKTLKKIRHLLMAAQAALSGRLDIGAGDPAVVMDYIIMRVSQEAVSYLEREFNDVIGDVGSWVLDKDADIWELLYECPLIEDMVVAILQAITMFRNAIFGMIGKLTSQITKRYQGIYRRWGIAYDHRRLSTILAIIDMVLAWMEACAKIEEVGDGSETPLPPEPAEDPRLLGTAPKPLKLPAEVVDRFFPNSRPLKRGSRLRPIPALGQVLTTAEDKMTNFRELCHGILPQSLIEQFLAQETK